MIKSENIPWKSMHKNMQKYYKNLHEISQKDGKENKGKHGRDCYFDISRTWNFHIICYKVVT